MADFHHPIAWAEEHPYVTGAVIFGGGLALLWLFGFFGSSSSSNGASGGAANMAAAYYTAEAQQAVVGGQIQVATLQTAAATKQAEIQADAATSIAGTQANRDMTIAASMYGAQTTLGIAGFGADVTKAGYAADVAKTGYAYGAQTAQVQSNDAMQTSIAHDNYGYLSNVAASQASEFNNYVSTVIPPELAASGGTFHLASPIGDFQAATGPYSIGTPQMAAAGGYSADSIAATFGGAPAAYYPLTGGR